MTEMGLARVSVGHDVHGNQQAQAGNAKTSPNLERIKYK
jgi:hypothetical protein